MRLLHSVALILLSVLMTNGAVRADEPGFAGNTIHSKAAGYGELFFAVATDGTFERSDDVSGTWTFDGSTLCFIVEGQDDLCGIFDGSKQVGDRWEEVAWDGNGMAVIHIMEGAFLGRP